MMDRIQLRRARPEDEAAIAAISAQIWEGEDYVPGRFADWAADDRGQFTVACDGDELVAFNKLTQLGPGEWWMEGLRVDPRHRGRGLARRLHHYAVALADAKGEGRLRLATNAANAAVQKMAMDSGFRLVSQHLMARVTAGATEEPLPLRLVTAEELPAVTAWLGQSTQYAASGELMEDNWVWLEIKPRLSQLQEQERLYWWQRTAGPASGLIIVNGLEKDGLWLNYLDVAPEDWPAVAAALPTLAARLRARQIVGKPLATAGMKMALLDAGWTVEQDREIQLYERPIGME